jgi:hypothetical protein
VFSGEPSYVEALFRLLLVVMSDSSSMEDDVESMGKQAIAAALAGEKVHFFAFFCPFLNLGKKGIAVSFCSLESSSRLSSKVVAF